MRFEDDELILSKIYDLYGVDFGNDEKELLQHLMIYANPGMKKYLESFSGVIDYEYNWELNSLL